MEELEKKKYKITGIQDANQKINRKSKRSQAVCEKKIKERY